MALTSLLVCADAQAVQTLSRTLLNMGMKVDCSSDPSSAVANFPQQHFDTVIVDCSNEEEASAYIQRIRGASGDPGTVIIALLNQGTNAREIFAKGANFVLYKPISDERLNKSVAAARTIMRREQRLTERIPVGANASIAYASTEKEVIRLVDLSTDGIAVYSGKPLPRDCKIYFEFSLPGERSTIRLSCEVIWQNNSGNVGMRFVDVPKSSRRILDHWIANKSGRHLEIAASPATVEESASNLRQQLASELGLVSAGARERRKGPRHACALGAEVARAGSTIQQRCVVSDLSQRGCYVQTSEPLPVGAAIEIVVRTQTTKLRTFGTVQSVHRGLGMGVRFTSEKVPEELQQLLAEAQNQQVSV